MTIFTDGLLMEPEEQGIHELPLSTSRYIGQSFTQGLEEGPTAEAYGAARVMGASRSWEMPDTDMMGNPVGAQAPATLPPTIAPDEARKRVKEAGLEEQLPNLGNAPVAEPALDIMMDHARQRKYREAQLARGPSGVFPAVAATGAGFLSGAIDPLNMAAFSVPVLGEARVARLMAGAGESIMNRAAVRAGVGAVQGAAGTLPLIPLDAMAYSADGRDYGFADALKSMAMNAGLGGVLHAAGGAGADVWRGWKGTPVYPFGPDEPYEGIPQARSLMAAAARERGATTPPPPSPPPPGAETTATPPAGPIRPGMFPGVDELIRHPEVSSRAGRADYGFNLGEVLGTPRVAENIETPNVDREHDVPNVALANESGGVFIDRNVPRLVDIDGVKFSPAQPLNVASQVEREALSRVLTAFRAKKGREPNAADMDRKNGILDYVRKNFVEPAERAWVTSRGIDWDKYQEAKREWHGNIDHENPVYPPQGAYLGSLPPRVQERIRKGAASPPPPPGAEAAPPARPSAEEAPPANPPGAEAAPPPPGTVGSVPFMVTAAMKRQLRDLGYSAEHIADLKPAEAHEIINAGRRAPEPPPAAPGARTEPAPDDVSDEALSATFRDEIAKMRAEEASAAAPAAESTPTAPPIPTKADIERTVSEVAKAAGEHGLSALDEAATGLWELFGRGKRAFSGLGFDEETYLRAKPHFIKAAYHFREAGGNVHQLMRMLIRALRDNYGFKTDDIERMEPYAIRFIQDVSSGALDLQREVENESGTRVPSQPELRAEILKIADDIEATGVKDALNFVVGMRGAAKNLNTPIRPDALDFYRGKLQDFRAQSGIKSENPKETYGIENMLDPKDAVAYREIIKSGEPPEVAHALKMVTGKVTDLVARINEAGFKVHDVNSASARELLNLKSELMGLGGSVSRLMKGLKRAKGDLESDRVTGDVAELYKGETEKLKASYDRLRADGRLEPHQAVNTKELIDAAEGEHGLSAQDAEAVIAAGVKNGDIIRYKQGKNDFIYFTKDLPQYGETTPRGAVSPESTARLGGIRGAYEVERARTGSPEIDLNDLNEITGFDWDDEKDTKALNEGVASGEVIRRVSPELDQNGRLKTTVEFANPAMEQERSDIAARVTEDLVNAGRPRDEAEATAAAIADHYIAMAEAFKGAAGSATDILNRPPIKVRRGGAAGQAVAVVSQKGEEALSKFSALAGLKTTGTAVAVPEIKSADDFVSAVGDLKKRLGKKKERKIDLGNDVVDAEILPPEGKSYEQREGTASHILGENFKPEEEARELLVEPEKIPEHSLVRSTAIDLKSFKDDADMLLGVGKQHAAFEMPKEDAGREKLADALNDAARLMDEHAQTGYALIERLDEVNSELYDHIDKVEDAFASLHNAADELRSEVVDKYNDIMDQVLQEMLERKEAEEEAEADAREARGEERYPYSDRQLAAIEREREVNPYPAKYTVLDVLNHERRRLEGLFEKAKNSPAVKALMDADIDQLDEETAWNLTDAVDEDISDLGHVYNSGEFWGNAATNFKNNAYDMLEAVKDEVVRPLLDQLETTATEVGNRFDEVYDEIGDHSIKKRLWKKVTEPQSYSEWLAHEGREESPEAAAEYQGRMESLPGEESAIGNVVFTDNVPWDDVALDEEGRYAGEDEREGDFDDDEGNYHRYMYDVAYTKDGRALISSVKVSHPRNEDLFRSEKWGAHLDKVREQIASREADELDERAEQAKEDARWNALTPEQQKAEVAEEMKQRAEMEQAHSETINKDVDAALARGWKPEFNEHGGWKRPPELAEWASPKSNEKIYARLRERGFQTPRSYEQRAAAGQTDTPEFKQWFGDSKVVGKDGKPLVMYHGTRGDFEAFDRALVNSRFPLSLGLHFTSDPAEASIYADDVWNAATKWNPNNPTARPVAEGANVRPVFLRAENPLVIDTAQLTASMEADLNRSAISERLGEAEREGRPYDSVIIKRQRGDEYDHMNVIVFDPTQIKSATGNRGTFDPNNPKMFEQRVAGFYSAVERAVTSSKQSKATADQWLGQLKNMPGVKPEEMEWLGLGDWLKEQKGPVTKDQVLDYVRANQIQIREVTKGAFTPELRQRLDDMEAEIRRLDAAGDPGWMRISEERGQLLRNNHGRTKYESYQLPGGENYREFLLQLPQEQFQRPKTNDPFEQIPYRQVYESPHWEEGNVVAHFRTNDRVINGKRTLHLEEDQSDWHQAGRKQGYEGEPVDTSGWSVERRKGQNLYGEPVDTVIVRDADGDSVAEMHFAPGADDHITDEEYIAQTAEERETLTARVPNAPFKTTWHELAIKRMIRYAAENGYDQISWTTGATQAARYDLTKHIREIHYRPEQYGGNLTVLDHTGRPVIDKTGVTPAELAETIGKEGADKLLNNPTEKTDVGGFAQHSLTGLDIKVGGSGMKGFYDQILPATVNKLVKKYGAKAGKGEIPAAEAEDQFTVIDQNGNARGNFATREDAEAFLRNPPGFVDAAQSRVKQIEKTAATPAVPVHTLPLTDKLKEAALSEGFPMFQRGEGGLQGRATFTDAARILELFQSQNASTPIHEWMGHFWLEELHDLGSRPDAPDWMKSDLATVREWLGAKGDEPPTTEQHEQFARGFEQYMREGRAPSRRLAAVFAKIREWMLAIYRRIQELGLPINDNIRGVFDRLLATQQDIAEYAKDRPPVPEEPTEPAAPKGEEGETVNPATGTQDILPPVQSQEVLQGAIGSLMEGRPVRAGEQIEATKGEEGGAPAAPAGWREIGTNEHGQTLFEDARGVRSYVEDSIRHTEPVGMRPTRAGVQPIIDRTTRPEFKTAEEVAAEDTDTGRYPPSARAAEVTAKIWAGETDFPPYKITPLKKEYGSWETTITGNGLNIPRSSGIGTKEHFINVELGPYLNALLERHAELNAEKEGLPADVQITNEWSTKPADRAQGKVKGTASTNEHGGLTAHGYGGTEEEARAAAVAELKRLIAEKEGEAPPAAEPVAEAPTVYKTPGTTLTWSNLKEWIDTAWKLRERGPSAKNYERSKAHWEALPEEFLKTATDADLKSLRTILNLPPSPDNPWGKPLRGQRGGTKWERLNVELNNEMQRRAQAAAAPPEAPAPPPPYEPVIPAATSLANHFRDYFLATPEFLEKHSAFLQEGNRFATIVQARRFAQEMGFGDDTKGIDEAIEQGAVQAARAIALGEGEVADKFKALVDVYDRQPRLSVRTSTSMRDQAYSTPVPLAYLASRLADVEPRRTVFEPSAGNGALLMEVDPPNFGIANEINPARARALEDQGFQVSQRDASTPGQGRGLKQMGGVDVVIANPPFGAVREGGSSKVFDLSDIQQGYKTHEIDHAVALRSLEAMKDNGSAVLLIGGVNKLAKTKEARSDAYNVKAKREFFKTLMDRYNVTDMFTVAGELYERQGAGWPIDVIVIKGRGKSELKLPAVEPPRVYKSWDQLSEVLNAAQRRGNEGVPSGEPTEAPVQLPAGPEAGGNGRDTETPGGGEPAGGVTEAGQPGPVLERPVPGEPGNEGAGGAGNEPPPAEELESGGGLGGAGGPGGESNAERPSSGVAGTGEAATEASEATKEALEPSAEPAAEAPKVRPRVVRTETETGAQVAYAPKSDHSNLGTLVPVNMKKSVTDALASVEERRGDVDAFVAKELGYSPNVFGDSFAAEQIDALALALDNLKQGKGFIIGDQTGIGKGRVNAGIIRWAIRNGRIPIFVTEKPNLYGDMYRDLTDIDLADMLGREPRFLMTNANEDVPLSEDGKVRLKTPPAKAHNAMLAELPGSAEELLKDYDVVFTNYSQMQTVAGEDTARRSFLGRIAPEAILIFDESHNAGGQKSDFTKPGPPDRASFARQLVAAARGVFYSSATYAKRPDVMDLYAKTDMALAVDNIKNLGDAIAKGGVPMQQAVASMLSRAGQYVRRERSFAGIQYDTPTVPVDREMYDGISGALNLVNEFSKRVADAAASIDQDIKASAGAVSADGSTGGAGASSVNFTSIMHNVINQALLAMKAKPAAKMAIEALEKGEKPVLTVSGTMESFLNDYAEDMGVKTGEPIPADFGDVLKKYLDRTRTLIVKKPFMKKGEKGERVYLSDAQLGPEGVAAYAAAKEHIDSIDLKGLPISPIDAIKNELTAAGYRVGEITGRGTIVDYSGKQPILRPRPGAEVTIKGRRQTIQRFNGGSRDNPLPKDQVYDAMILNQAGSTGISLHASDRFAERQPRVMFIVQPEANIDTHMQLLGRIHRTGQVVLPRYAQLIADIPAEKRPAAVLAKKMASLNANTTAARGSAMTAKDVPDFMNVYGDMVAAQLMQDNPEINARLSSPVGIGDDGRPKVEDAMRKVTGRIPLLPIGEQERLYSLLESEYASLLDQMKAAGENALEAQTLDLRAQTIERREVVAQRQASDSPFAAPVQLEKTMVRRLGKPYRSDEVVSKVLENIGESEPVTAENAARVLDDLSSDRTPLGRANAEKHAEQAKEALADFDLYKRSVLDEIEKPERQEVERARKDAIKDRWTSLHDQLKPGERVNLKTVNGNLAGIVLKIEHKTGAKDPLALSTWKVEVALADATRRIELPFSRLYDDGRAPGDDAGAIEVGHLTDWFETKADTLRRFDSLQSDTREQRYIATGNLLAAYDWLKNKGRIINYTDDQGHTRQGILTPKDFDLQKHADSNATSIGDETAVMGWLRDNPGTWLKTDDGFLRVQLNRHGNATIEVAQSKRAGGVYYLDKPLTDAMGRDFVKRGGAMTADVREGNLQPAIARIQELGGKFVTVKELPPAETVAAPAPAAAPTMTPHEAWNTLASEPLPHEERAALEASREAEAMPEPASVSTETSERAKAAMSAAEEATQQFESAKDYMPEEDRAAFESTMQEYSQEQQKKADVIRQGIACLSGGGFGKGAKET